MLLTPVKWPHARHEPIPTKYSNIRSRTCSLQLVEGRGGLVITVMVIKWWEGQLVVLVGAASH